MVIAVAGFLYSQPLYAAGTLDLDTFIKAILDNNPGVQRILAQEAIAAGNLESSKGIDDPALTTRGTLSQTEPDKINGFEPDRSRDKRLDVSLDRLYSSTGTRLGVDYGNLHTQRDPASTALGAKYYQPSLTLRLTQPLLKNARGIQDRLDLELNRLELDLSRLQTREELESYVTRLASLYLEWYLAHREMSISSEVYEQSIQQEKLVRLKVNRQVAEAYELYRAQETRADYYSRWQQDVGTYEGLTQQINTQMLARPTDDDRQPVDPASTSLLAPAITEPDYLATRSRLKAILDMLRAQQEILVDARSDARKPDLNLSLAYSRHGADDSLSDAHTRDLEQNDYSVMLEYRYPLGNRSARGAMQSQIASRQQVGADTAQQLVDAQAALADLMAQADKLAIALQAVDDKIALATKKLKAEQRLYNIGELDLFELIQDQTAQLESRLNRERLFIQLLQIRLSIGELLDRNLDELQLPPLDNTSHAQS
jgi:outer membrane protein TolC